MPDFGAPDSMLEELSLRATQLQNAEAAVAEAEAELAVRKELVRQLAEHEIPLLMAECGVEEFTTTSGYKVEIKSVYTASIPEDLRDEAHRWLDKHGHGGMIKQRVVVSFGRDERMEAAELARDLRESGLDDIEEIGKVEPSTLRAWVRRQIEENREFPRSLFGAAEIRRAKITEAKRT